MTDTNYFLLLFQLNYCYMQSYPKRGQWIQFKFKTAEITQTGLADDNMIFKYLIKTVPKI